jgi:tetratricopeptide (TPR) repeat protein
MAQGEPPVRPADPAHFFARVLADQHYQKGLERDRRGEWDLALASYRRACSLDPNNVLYLLARGHICQTHGLEPEAEECYAVALRIRPDETVALYNQAQLFAARGQLDEALANLDRIVAGGVDALGERAAPIFSRLGDIAVRRRDYVAAAVHYRRALECTPGQRYAAATLAGLERFAEFERPFDQGGGVEPKVAFYGYAGAMLLGLPGDDGIAVPAYPGLGFDSLAELAQTLVRFTALARRLHWRFDVVAALDAESQPLAIALASALGARVLGRDDQCPRDAGVLGVTGTAADQAVVGAAMAALRRRTARALLYAVGVARPLWEYEPAVQVASAPGRLEFPWHRAEAAAPEHAEAFGVELGAALAALNEQAPEPTVEAQLSWYGLSGGGGHHRLSFDRQTLEARPEREATPPQPCTDGESGHRRLIDSIA